MILLNPGLWLGDGDSLRQTTKMGGAGYVGLRRSQSKGINIFLMIGDPNTVKFKKGGAVKIIIPII